MKQPRLRVILAAMMLAVAIAIYFWPFNRRGEPFSLEEIPRMCGIEQAILYYYFDTGRLPFDKKAINDVNDEKLFQKLMGDNPSNATYLRKWPHWLRAGKLVDLWGREYRISVTNAIGQRVGEEGLTIVTILSIGPNGRFESGAGDDIVHEFSLRY